MTRLAGAAVLALAAVAPAAAERLPPAPTAWFVDRAGLVSPAAGRALDGRLANLEKKSGVRVVVYVEPLLPEGEALEDYTLRAVESWTVWHHDRAALALFIFPESRRMRLEVGYGAEAAVTDLEARRILDEVVAPAFRKRDYESGIARAIDALDLALSGELPPPKKAKGLDDSFVLFLIVLAVLWLFVLPLFSRRRRSRLRRGGFDPWVVGGPWSGGGWGGRGSSGGGSIFGGGGGLSGGGSIFGGGGASGDW